MKRGLCALLLLVCAVFAQDVGVWNYNKSAPLNTKVAGTQVRDDVSVQDISYDSPVVDRGPSVGPNGGHVTAYLVLPKGKGPFPAVIYQHWCMPGSEMKNRKEFLDEAVLLARSGVMSLLPDHVRVRPNFVEDKATDSTQEIDVTVQEVMDLRRGADLLLARKDVDPKRLGYVGHSCGGSAGEILSGVDKRFKTFVIMAGGLADAILITTKPMQAYRQNIGPDKFDAFVAKHSIVDPGKYIAHAAPASLFFQYASHEPIGGAEEQKENVALASEPKKMKIYEAEHALNPEATSDRIAFLAEQLSFKPPAAKDIAAIPALTQPPWPGQSPQKKEEKKE